MLHYDLITQPQANNIVIKQKLAIYGNEIMLCYVTLLLYVNKEIFLILRDFFIAFDKSFCQTRSQQHWLHRLGALDSEGECQ